MTDAKVDLGRHLFYDTRVSMNGRLSCASCHDQASGFADHRAQPIGAAGQPLLRSSMSLVNVAYAAVLTWSRPDVHTLEQQALTPLLSDKPIELGFSSRRTEFFRELRADGLYQKLFSRAFPAQHDPFTLTNLIQAIASFERSIISARSPYDKFRAGDANAIPDSAKRGEVLFFTDSSGGCYRCHGGFEFSDAVDYVGRTQTAPLFHNNGLYNLPGLFSYPAPNLGIYEYTRRRQDIGKFKAPSLRNIALTAPYMHDGSLPTLEAVVDHYASGGQHNPNQDPRVRERPLTAQNRKDLVAFLESLTDEELRLDPRFADPW